MKAENKRGRLHHVEIYAEDLEKMEPFWSWFLEELGYTPFQRWDGGFSHILDGTYIVFVQADKSHLEPSYHRCRPGLNHLAFYAKSPEDVDRMTEKLRERGITILYEDRHPHAGGPHSYGVFFEDPQRMKVEFTT